jgi:hypothetical protein
LVFSNAQCFLRCELDAGDHTAPPCHQQSKPALDHCLEQHDVAAIAVHTDFDAWAPADVVLELRAALPIVHATADPSPPADPASASLTPLRI